MVSVAEEWRAIPGFEGMYEVSNYGRVRGLDRETIDSVGRLRRFRGCLIKTHVHPKTGYAMVVLANHRKRTMTLHSVVASAFVGPRPDGMHVNHIDGNKKNNCSSNLEYVTRTENMAHAKQMGLCDNGGERNGRATVTNEQMRKAFDCLLEGMTTKQAAAKVGIAPHVISAARKGRHWKSLGLPSIPPRRGVRSVTASTK